MAASDTDNDDYLTMTFTDDPTQRSETSLQRRSRLANSVSERSRVPSKAERAAKERDDLSASLSKQIDPSSKGAQMLAKMGFAKGGALGKSGDGRTQPISISVKADRAGIGLESERKRKFDEAVEGVETKKRITAAEFRERNRVAREERHAEGAMWAAMKTLEEIEEGEGGAEKPLRAVNVLYRPLVRQRVEREREGRVRGEVMRGLATREGYEDEGSETGEDEGKPAPGTEVEDDPVEGDGELEEFEALSFRERLERIVGYLREKHRFCFWCKYKYPDEAMEGCPGLTEEDHD